MRAQALGHARFLATKWIVAQQTPLSVRFPRQECCSGLPFPIPGGLPGPGIKPTSPAFSVLAGRSFAAEPPGKPLHGKHLKQVKEANGKGERKEREKPRGPSFQRVCG